MTTTLTPPLALWLLRVLVRRPRGGLVRLPPPDANILAAAGIARAQSLSPDGLKKRLAARLTCAERDGMDRSAPAFRNVELLSRMFGLDAVERDLVAFIAHLEHEEVLAELIGSYGYPSKSKLTAIFAAAIGTDAAEVRRALRGKSRLLSSGLVQHPTRSHFREVPLRLMNGVAETVLRERASSADLARHFFRPSVPSALSLEDFAHMGEDVKLLRQLAAAAVSRRRRGVNILLYGAPGTGKTELARALAADLGMRLYAVNDEDEDGDTIHGPHRLRACVLAQRVLERNSGALLVFDEIEDVFPRRANAIFGPTLESTSSKSWTHRLLEENGVPTIWITNAVDHMDRATLRRFALAIELKAPPIAVRRRMLASRLPFRLSEQCIERYARDERVTLAHIDRATSIVRLIGVRSPAKTEAVLTRVVDANVAMCGARKAASGGSLALGRYDLRFVNAEVDLDRLMASLARSPSASICLYGAPGTGKTAFASYVAERLGRPLQVERASDLLRPMLGETEQLMASMFERAREDGSVLLLDEADSFLRDRTQAVRSWEITQTNELLVQMEAHDGIFFCATNLVETLDAASLRRFALKIELRPLLPAQRWAIFTELLATAGGEPAAHARGQLDRLHTLTPGDFATAMRRLALMSDGIDSDGLLAALQEECALKRGGSGGRIGFAS